MGRHSDKRHSVTGYTELVTYIYLQEFAAEKGWSLSQLSGYILDRWADRPSRSDLDDPEARKKTLARLHSGDLHSIPKIFKKEPYVPLRMSEIEGFHATSIEDRVRLFIAKAKAGRSDAYPVVAIDSTLLAAEASRSKSRSPRREKSA